MVLIAETIILTAGVIVLSFNHRNEAFESISNSNARVKGRFPPFMICIPPVRLACALHEHVHYALLSHTSP